MGLRFEESAATDGGNQNETPAGGRLREAIASHRTPRQRLHAALQTMAKDGLLSHAVPIDRFVDDIFGPPGVHAPSSAIAPGRRI